MKDGMKNYGLLLDWSAWCSLGGGDRHLRAPPALYRREGEVVSLQTLQNSDLK